MPVQSVPVVLVERISGTSSLPKEPLAEILCTLHNLHFYQQLMAAIRQAIEEDRFEAWAREFLARTGQQKAADGVF